MTDLLAHQLLVVTGESGLLSQFGLEAVHFMLCLLHLQVYARLDQCEVIESLLAERDLRLQVG